MDRSLGIIVYSDGSQAEVLEVEGGISIRPLAKARRLIYAPFGLLSSSLVSPALLLSSSLVSLALLLSSSLVGCVHLPVKGDRPICLIDSKTDSKTGIQHCDYDTWEACYADAQDRDTCYRR